MSASSKKKLRKEQDAAKMTEKQLAEAKEAKKTQLYTVVFVVAMVAILVSAICIGVYQTVVNSGIRERNTVALTVGEHKISNAELSYFYIDVINNFYSNYGSYAALFGLDVTSPLDEQVTDEETGSTWADDFLTSAKENAQATYALADAAEAAGYELSEDEQSSLDSTMSYVSLYATLYGYSSADDYLQAIYGNGADEESYRAYCELTTLADSYYSYYSESLSYTDEDLRAAEAENYSAYSSFTYNTYYLSASRFLEGGTTDDDGNTTYSDEETAASVTAAEEAAQALTGDDITSVEELDEAIAALSINADSDASSTSYTDTLYSSVSSTYRDWLSEDGRKAGDKTYFVNSSTSTDDEGNETTTVSGYYVIYLVDIEDNTFALANVRHILVAFEGGTTDDDGNTTYSDEEIAAAKEAAEALLEQWESGDATEESFAELANEESDDGDGTTGGLYEDIYPGQMVTAFNDWCFDESRKAGDTDIIETEYGYHVMYYVGDSAYSYRDYLIESDLRSADLSTWYTQTVEAISVTEGSTKYIETDLVLSSS